LANNIFLLLKGVINDYYYPLVNKLLGIFKEAVVYSIIFSVRHLYMTIPAHLEVALLKNIVTFFLIKTWKKQNLLKRS
jgi:hypothetical protein